MGAAVRRVSEWVREAWARLIRAWTVLLRGPDALFGFELARASERIEKETLEREAAQAELVRSRSRAQELERLCVVASGVAHDLGNLLAAILGQTQIALEATPQAASVREPLERSVAATRRAADVARQLFVHVGVGGPEPRTLELNELVRENVTLFRSAIPRAIELRAELDPDLPPISADPGQIQQVVMNLILNAVEAIGPGEGSITVSTGTRQLVKESAGRRPQTIPALRPGSYVRLCVEDTGRGLDAESLERIFDPFFTTRSGGHGIGLATVLGVLRAHQGGIEVESAPGRGSAFRLLLPQRTSASDGLAASVSPTPVASHAPVRHESAAT